MAPTSDTPRLRTAVASYPHTQALKDGRVDTTGVVLDHDEVVPITRAFRRMCRTLDYDVCEMAVTTYLTARTFGKPFTGLPVFVLRNFHHGAITYNTKSGVRSPKDLEGKTVGVRAYTVTTGVWARGILASEYGVDLDRITWVVVDEEHVTEYIKPANVVERPGASLADMLARGELAAAIGAGRVDSLDVAPLIPDAREAAAKWYRRTGIYPVNHMVVVKNSVLETDPTLAPRLYAAFEAAKQSFLTGSDDSPEARAILDRRSIVGDDPLPNGAAANAKSLATLARFAHEQKILPRVPAVEEMFPEGAWP